MRIAFVYNCQRYKVSEEAEFDTQDTVTAIRVALESESDQVFEIEMTRDGSWVKQLVDRCPDIVFTTAEGFKGVGRESLVPIICEQLGIPYVGCGPYTCFLTLDKFLTKQVVTRQGVPTPDAYFISDIRELEAIARDDIFPVFVKPNFEGSSKGISVRSRCSNMEELQAYTIECFSHFPEGILVEKYIEGKDVTVPYVEHLGERGVLEPIEYVGIERNGLWIYDYELKNIHDEQVSVKCPADLDPEVRSAIMEYMRKCVSALAVVDMGRADFRVTPSGEVYFIELNALPSLQPGAGIFESAKLLGLTYNETIQKILNSGLSRLRIERNRVRKPKRRMTIRNPKIAVVYNLKRKIHDQPDFEFEAEYDSRKTIEALANTIASLSFEVISLEADRELANRLESESIDLVFNIAEGQLKRAREAQVPAICDLLGIEHTASDATCLAVTLDKAMTSKLMAAEGITVPGSILFSKPPKNLKHKLKFPIIVKPNLEGTSKGIYESSVVTNDGELKDAMDRLWKRLGSPFLCEEYVAGREFTVGIFGQINLQAVGPLEVVFKERTAFPVYSFEAKQAENQLDNEFCKLVYPPENLNPRLEKKIKEFAKKCFRVVGCRDVARVDLRISHDEKIYFLEINPLPGLCPGFSDLTILTEKMGWSYVQLIKTILLPAIRRWRRSNSQHIGTM